MSRKEVEEIIKAREGQSKYFNEVVSKELIKTVEDKNKPSINSLTAWKNWLVSYLSYPVVDTPIEPEEVYPDPTNPETAISNPIILETFKKIEKVLETYGEEL